jgi:HEAT repeat protein
MRRYVLLLLAFTILTGCHLRSVRPPAQSTASPNAEVSAAVSKLLKSVAAAGEDSPDKTDAALAAIVALGEPAIPVLSAARSDPDENVRLVAVQALATFNTPNVVDPLLAALKDENAQVRTEAVRALGNLREQRAVQPLLEQSQQDDTASVRYDCLTSLGQIGDPVASPLLLTGTHDDDPYVRMWSMTALCDMHHEQAPELALTLVRDANVYVRRQVLVGCKQALDTPRGRQALIDLALADDFQTALMARQALANYRQKGSESEELTEHMRRAGRSSLHNPAQAVNAALLLGDLRDPAAVDGLMGALHDANYFVRALAARQLGDIGERRAVPAVIKALSDPQDLVVAAGYIALQRFAEGGDAQAQEALESFRQKKLHQPSAQ